MEHHRQLVDAIDVDAQGECSSVIVRCHLDDERQGQDVTKGKLRHPDRALAPGPNIECPGSRIHLGMIGDEGALDPHQNETRTAWSERFRRAACGHCPLVHGRRLGSSPDVDSRVTPNGTLGAVKSGARVPDQESMTNRSGGVVSCRSGDQQIDKRRRGARRCWRGHLSGIQVAPFGE